MDSIVKCENLTHYYGKRCIYENINFSIERGKILGLLGKNGTGKTTTINILNGYLKPHSGKCEIFGENSSNISPENRMRIGILIEGHVQYSFMNITQIERFYSQFYPKWQKNIYYELMDMLKIAPQQRISKMSCGQRSQVALGLILAQNAELLILDDFSMGLDPGYRMLFVDYLSEYAKKGNKTVFITSHIIQDMERLIDDCMIMDYGKIVLQKPVKEFTNSFFRYRFETQNSLNDLTKISNSYNPNLINNNAEIYSFLTADEMNAELKNLGIKADNIKCEKPSLEEAFIGITGKY